MKECEAMYYKKLETGEVVCLLCPHKCWLKEGQRGVCRGRTNIQGRLVVTNYGKSVALGLDPIEKKPLYHYFPGTQIVSLGSNSCNLACSFCQNYRISQADAPTETISSKALRALIQKYSPQDLQVAFTYSEPLTWYEYIRDFALKYPEIRIILVSNGFINPEPFAELLPYISALNIDLKAIDNEFYTRHCRGSLQPVLESILQAHAAKKHLEITLLLIEGLNDAAKDIAALAGFIAGLNPDIPLHISAYHPAYKLKVPATPQAAIETAIAIAKKQLNYVYGGNLHTTYYMQSHCPKCGNLLIKRDHDGSKSLLNEANNCSQCGHAIYGIFA